MKNKVGVVILTYNRLNLLKITLCKVLNQTYKPLEVLVVDNNSTDGTKEYLAGRNEFNTLLLEDNTGPAGGFYEGIKYFAESTDVDYVWLMDDDFFPFVSCLEILMKSANNEKILFPYAREKDFVHRKEPGWWGVLVPMSIIKTVGYPNKELFFWAEDTEYLLHRIREKHSFKAEWISAAKGVHFTQRNKNHRKPWKYYYEVRNMLYMRLYVRKPSLRRYYKLLRSWVFLLGAILLKDDEKLMKSRLFMLGTYHGITKKMGKRIDPATGKKLKVK